MIFKQLTNEQFTEFANSYKDKSIYQTKEYAFIMNKQNFESISFHLEHSKMSVLRFLKECLKHNNTKAKSDFHCSLYFHFHYIFTSKGWHIQKKIITFYFYNLKTFIQTIRQNNFQFLTFWLVFWYPRHPSILQDVTANCFLKMWYRMPGFIRPNGK